MKWDTNRRNREVLVVVAVSVSKSMVSTFDSVSAFHMAGTVPCTFSVPACAETVNSPKLTVPNGTEVRVV